MRAEANNIGTFTWNRVEPDRLRYTLGDSAYEYARALPHRRERKRWESVQDR